MKKLITHSLVGIIAIGILAACATNSDSIVQVDQEEFKNCRNQRYGTVPEGNADTKYMNSSAFKNINPVERGMTLDSFIYKRSSHHIGFVFPLHLENLST